ncbi:lysosomal protective protein [Ixodes scapularis]|uniref:lysosomal protective protein n=1 Tax=Ixodes scapularis TaxID=6945 RepID=UPI001C3811D0|nr:lysosomal protective protein [Ixodes scapularis]
MTMIFRVATLAATLLFLCPVQAQGSQDFGRNDEVWQLPGLAKQTSFRHYSGYLRVGGSRLLHYWYVESERSPETDPVVLWMNGGPGCSSLLGLMTELGPFHMASDGLNLTMNPYSWNKVANVIFLEAPAGVGFSYDPSGDYHTNDDQTADDNYLAVQQFFAKFPNLRDHDFYITGESYGGIYVPMLASRVLQDPRGIRLKGIAIGNGFLDAQLLGNALVFFGYYHGLYGLSLWTRLTENCCNGSVSQHSCNFQGHVSDKCNEAVEEASYVIRDEGLNIYNLYDRCEDRDNSSRHFRGRGLRGTTRMDRSRELMLKSLNRALTTPNLRLEPPCVDEETVIRYFNREDVKVALHVDKSPLRWSTCSDVLKYESQYETMRPVVKELVDSGTLKTLIYNGDVDMACNFLGDEWFVNTLGYAPTSTYKPWKHGKQVAGFFQTYERNLTFLTIKGSGHMVPQDKPAHALQMISNFLFGTPF